MPVVEADRAKARADELVTDYGRRQESLIHVLQDIQSSFDYLPRPALEHVSRRLELPLAEVLRVATFYRAFSLEPRGEHVISVCTGTACHVRGAPRILEALRQELGLEEGASTTDDLKFTVQSVRCLGCCALAPVITVGEDVHGLLKPDMVAGIVEQYA